MRQKSLLKNEHGYTFVFALLVLVLISVLGLGLMFITSNTLNTTKHERNDQSLFYIAEAALNVKKQEVYKSVYKAYDVTRDAHKGMNKEKRDKTNFNQMFIDEIMANLTSQPVPYSNFELQFNQQPEACVNISSEPIDETTYKININSAGYLLDSTDTDIETESCDINNVKHKRVVEQNFVVDINLKFLTDIDDENGGGHVPDLPKLAVQTSGDINLGSSSKIHGSILTNNGKVHLEGGGGERITGNIGSKYPVTASYASLEKEHAHKVVNVSGNEIPLPPFPSDKFATLSTLPDPEPLNLRNKQIISNGSFQLVDGPKDNNKSNTYPITITQDTRFKTFKIENDNTLELNIGSNTVNLLIDTFTLQQGHINIVGSGTLNIYIKNSMELENSSKVNLTGNTNQMNIYYAGSNLVNLENNNVKINSSLYAQSANLHLTGSLGFQGNIITGGSEVKIGGASNSQAQYILAPNADVTISNSGKITGILIAKSLNGSGSAEIYYNDDFVVPPPFPPTSTPDYSDPEKLITEEDLIER